MTTLDPRQLWRRTARTGNHYACKTMHLLHARLKNGKFAENWHKKTGFNGAGWGRSLGDRLTPRGARCSTPPALKASFSTGGVCSGQIGHLPSKRPYPFTMHLLFIKTAVVFSSVAIRSSQSLRFCSPAQPRSRKKSHSPAIHPTITQIFLTITPIQIYQ